MESLDVSINMALIQRNLFVKYLEQIGIADTDIVGTLIELLNEQDFYQKLFRISAGQLNIDILRSNLGAEEYKVLVNFARERLGAEPLFRDIGIDTATYNWLSASEDIP